MPESTNQQTKCSEIKSEKLASVQEQDSCAANCSAYWSGMIVGMVLFNSAYIAVNSLLSGGEYELVGVDLLNDSGFSGFDNVTNISGC